MPSTAQLSPMGQAALQYVRRGWPVFPCHERDKPWRNAAGKEGLNRAKAPYIGNGLKDATRDEQRVKDWWRRNPEAMIGVPLGVNGCFVVDFDPRFAEQYDALTGEILVDQESGEPMLREWTLGELKAELEAMMGVELPPSLTSRTPSGGVHVWFRQPKDGGPEIRNSVGGKKLNDHVDVRGAGGYVIAPPSSILDGSLSGAAEGEYRWIERRGDWRDDAAIAEAPTELLALLRAPREKKAAEARGARLDESSTPSPAKVAANVDDDIRRYCLRALDGECKEIRDAQSGKRNQQLFTSALKISSLVAAGALDAGVARSSIEAAARANPGRDDDGQLLATINSGWSAGSDSPRDLSEIAAASRSRRERASPPFRGSGHRAGGGVPAPAPPAPAPAPAAASDQEPFPLGEGDAARLVKASAKWLDRRLEHVDRTRDAVTKLAFTIGRRISAGLIDEHAAKQGLWDVYEGIADVQHEEIDRAISDGINRGFDLEPLLLTMKCCGYPLTDFGIAERFRDRFGRDFRFTTAKGWLGWDGRRWKEFDQDKEAPPAEVIAAVYDTVRAIQDEGRFIADTGRKVTEEDLPDGELFGEKLNPHGLERTWLKGKTLVFLSETVKAFGRSSETTGKPASVANLAKRWLSVPISSFDHDKFAFNVMNGTLRFRRETMADGRIVASVMREDHCREDMLTKLSPVEYDPSAACPLYDDMIEWAQPDKAMRRYLHQLGGYSLSADAAEQKLWFWYGRGRNGKGVTIESWNHVAGEYAGTVPIASLLDQSIKKRGDQASPDLAKLAGVRMLRSSEPGRNQKLDTGLIKLVTGGEPVPVRMLQRGFFDLDVQFKLIISGNSKFEIPDTDDGIWDRLKLVSWLRHIDKPPPDAVNWPKKDPHLVDKIKAQEGSGVLNRLIAGLLDWMENGLVEPAAVTEATSAYRDASDPLSRFLRMCTAEDPQSKVQSSRLYEVFVAWMKAAGEQGKTEWSNKGFSSAMTEKGYEKKASNGMQWLGLRLTKDVSDFVDEQGRPRSIGDDAGDPARAPPDDFDVGGFDDLAP
jgi:putative DNA primase/helicase